MIPSSSSHFPLVLVINSDPATAQSISLCLEPLGCSVVVVENSALAMKQEDAGRIVMILLDPNHPDDDQPFATEPLRERWPGRPIFALVSTGSDRSDEYYRQSFDGVLEKPVQSEALLSLVMESKSSLPINTPLDSGKAPDPPSSPPPPANNPVLNGFHELIEEMSEMGEGINSEFILDLAGSFVERGRVYVLDIKKAAATCDVAAMDKHSHAMKGMAGNLRFMDLVAINEEIRDKVKSGNLAGISVDIETLEGKFDEVCHALRDRWLNAR